MPIHATNIIVVRSLQAKDAALAAAFLVFGSTASAWAGAHPGMRREAGRLGAILKARNDHPPTPAAHNPDLKLNVTTDAVLRSCSMPPMLVVGGEVTNSSGHSIDYVKLILAFEDDSGRVVYAETMYNSRAASISDDARIRMILGEEPHFEPLAPGASDTFGFSIPPALQQGRAVCRRNEGRRTACRCQLRADG